MSRVANNPISLPGNVEVSFDQASRAVRVALGGQALTHTLHPLVALDQSEANVLTMVYNASDAMASKQAGTARAILANMVQGVTEGFSETMLLKGVGYKAQLKGTALVLSLGYSHPVEFTVPEGITIELPNATTLVIKGADKQQVGEIAAQLYRLRPARRDPYKGKGVRYANSAKRQEFKKEVKK